MPLAAHLIMPEPTMCPYGFLSIKYLNEVRRVAFSFGLMSCQGAGISSQLFHGACAEPMHRPHDSRSGWSKASVDLLLKERVNQGAEFCAAMFIPKPFLVVRTWRPFKGLVRSACTHKHGSSWPGQCDLSLNFPGQRILAISHLAASGDFLARDHQTFELRSLNRSPHLSISTGCTSFNFGRPAARFGKLLR